MRVLLSGGGTMGSVSPLIAVAKLLQQRGHEVLFVGTRFGPEQGSLKAYDIPFVKITAFKLRRYFSWRYLFIPLEFVLAMAESFLVLIKWRPQVIVSAGGFVSVPLIWVGWILKIPSVVHQQDVRIGLANKLSTIVAKTMTVTFKESLKYFPKKNTHWIGNPHRNLLPTTNAFVLDAHVPTVLIMGGGTGAQALNELVSDKLCAFANVIHLTGKNKRGPRIFHPRFHQRNFVVKEMNEILTKADLVVCRAGIGTITELIALGKPAILLPLPNSGQEENAKFLLQHHAAMVLYQDALTPERFTDNIRNLLQHPQLRQELATNIGKLMPPQANQMFVNWIEATPKKC